MCGMELEVQMENTVGEQYLQANAGEIERFIAEMTRDWGELDGNPMIEIRSISQSKSINVARFSLDWIDEAARHAQAMNEQKYNIYMCVNPVDGSAKIGAGKGAKDEHIMAAFYCFADADDDNAMQNILSFAGPQFTISVRTGTEPYVRGHAYWRLEEPCMNLDAWRDAQKNIAATLNTDRAVINPSRIMRVAGSVSWPDTKKQAKGYIPELVTMRTKFSTDRDPIPFERIMRAFPKASETRSEAAQAAGPISIDLGQQAMDRALVEQEIMSGGDWHNNIIRLVASYVAKGMSDGEIHALTDRFTMEGYSVDDTREEVQKAIDGARSKGWTPPPDPITERFDAQVPKIALEPEQPAEEEGEHTWPTPVAEINELALPKREWVYGQQFIRKYLTVTASAGGIGKTSLTMVEGLAVATGQQLLDEEVREQTNVWVLNLEDPLEEMQLRLAAAMKKYGIKYGDVKDRLFMDGEDTIQITLAAENREGIVQNDALLKYMAEKIIENDIGLVIVDPFVSIHMVNENSNMAVQQVVAMLRKLARDTKAAIHLVHHIRKSNGEDATVDSVRGAVSLIGAARAARVINKVSEADAIELGVPQLEARGIMRVDDAKANLAAPAERAVYRRMVGVQLANEEWVGVATSFALPDEWDGMTEAVTNTILRRIEAGPGDGELYSVKPQSKSRWAGNVILEYIFDNPDHRKTEAQAKSIIRQWEKTGLIEEGEYRSEKQRKDRSGIINVAKVGEQSEW